MNIVSQPNSWSCYACVAAMIVGKSLEDFIEFTGHDGSEIDEESEHPDKRRGFWHNEVVKYLAHYNYALGWCAADIRYLNPTEIIQNHTHIKIEWPVDSPALIVVKSEKLEGCTHCLYWNGKKLLDPYENDGVNFKDYRVLEWWPVKKFKD